MGAKVRIDECAERGCKGPVINVQGRRYVVGCMATKTLHDCCATCIRDVIRAHTISDCAGVVVTTPEMKFRWEGA